MNHLVKIKSRFVNKIKTGKITQTICRKRTRAFKPGDLISFMATRNNKDILFSRFKIVSISTIRITDDVINIDGVPLDVDTISRHFGFKTGDAFKSFYRSLFDIPFEGILIRWDFNK